MDEEYEFENFAPGAASTYSVLVSALPKNSYVVLHGRPCKIVGMETSKEERSKVRITAVDFYGRRTEATFFETDTVEIPNINRKKYQLIDINNDGFLSLMDGSGDAKDDIKLPEVEIGAQIKEAFEVSEGDVFVTVVSVMGEEHAVAVRQSVK